MNTAVVVPALVVELHAAYPTHPPNQHKPQKEVESCIWAAQPFASSFSFFPPFSGIRTVVGMGSLADSIFSVHNDSFSKFHYYLKFT